MIIVFIYNKNICFRELIERVKSSSSGATVEEISAPKNSTFLLNRQMPILFIGGVPRSGTTLMRSIMDSHPMVRCGEETRIIPRMLGLHHSWTMSKTEMMRLDEAGLTKDVVDEALAGFMLETIVGHGKPAQLFCNKDPFTIKYVDYILDLFPNSKHVMMLRDGRATVHSVISRNVTISGWDLTSYPDCMKKWNRSVMEMYLQCLKAGPSTCMFVRYEDLVLHPRATIKTVLDFAGVPWHENVMNHQEHMDQISLSDVEKSTDQVVKPLYNDSLKNWVGHFTDDELKELIWSAPMMDTLGYKALWKDPVFEDPDEEVTEKYNKWLKWKESHP